MSLWSVSWRVAAGIVVVGVLAVAVLIVARQRGWREPAVSGGPAIVRLITAEQYVATVHDLFGEDIEMEVSFPAVQRQQGLLALGASAAVITPGALEQFDRAARTVATQALDEAHRPMLVPCMLTPPNKFDVACAKQFFFRVGRFLYRRPLTEQELLTQVTVAEEATQNLGNFYLGIAHSLAGMLTSPKFLYLAEVTEPDPERAGQLRLNAYSKATRLSLFMWNSLPDEALLQAAERGELHDQRALERQVDRMLASPRLEEGVRGFFSDLLVFDKFETLAKDPVIYPAFTRGVARSAKEQALRLITDHLLTRKGDYRDLFTTSRTFVDTALGPLYDVPITNPLGWTSIELDKNQSAGYLTSLSFLTLHSHPGRSSPTLRGKAFREELLCQHVPDPPPNVNFTIFEDPNRRFKTTRDSLQAHATDPVCAGCHKLTDPMGLALENFDGAGIFRTKENGASIDTQGMLDGRPFKDIGSLGQAMHSHPALGPCLASRLYAYGIGREITAADGTWLEYIARRFAVHGYRLPQLLREIASSRAFYALEALS